MSRPSGHEPGNAVLVRRYVEDSLLENVHELRGYAQDGRARRGGRQHAGQPPQEPDYRGPRGRLDVLLPKPTADKVADAHAIIEAVRSSGRFLGVDFHKREDPVTKEARARYAEGVYGRLQSSTMYMLDRLLVSNPNHEPRSFASADFAEKNTPVSFLTSHMADTFMHITRLRPLKSAPSGTSRSCLRSRRSRQRLRPRRHRNPLRGRCALSHHLRLGAAGPRERAHRPDGAVSLHRLHARPVARALRIPRGDPPGHRRPQHSFQEFRRDGTVFGFGMDCPGKILSAILRFRNGKIGAAEKEEYFSPFTLGL